MHYLCLSLAIIQHPLILTSYHYSFGSLLIRIYRVFFSARTFGDVYFAAVSKAKEKNGAAVMLHYSCFSFKLIMVWALVPGASCDPKTCTMVARVLRLGSQHGEARSR